MNILFSNETEYDTAQAEKIIERVAPFCFDMENVEKSGEISCLFVNVQAIRELNVQYRGIDRATDVLSFPLYNGLKEIRLEAAPVLGDVVLCLEKAFEQAREYGHSPEREIAFLTVHSILHLFGYDHIEEEEEKAMFQRQEAILQAAGIGR